MQTTEQALLSPEQMAEQRAYAKLVLNHPDRPHTFTVVTYGCQMNAHDSEYLTGMLQEMGLTEAADRESADFVIFNTCCVRDNAERRALGNVSWLKHLKSTGQKIMIAVCGCMVQQPEMAKRILEQYRFIDLAFGTSNLYKLPQMMYEVLCGNHKTILHVDERDVIPEGMPVKRLRDDFAYITVMYGCDNFCSYCVVPYVRGRERSREFETILREAEELKQSGVKEIMLLGQNVNSYGKGLGGEVTFAKLLKALDDVGIPRIRFMTSHPKDLSDELIEAMGTCKHVLPQFHLPVQSGNDRILKEMNRHYDRARYLQRVRDLRAAVPDIGLTTDIIVGFPGETEAEFEDTLSLVEEVGYDSAFTFIYSPRNGTKAAKMPNRISEEEASRRIQKLIATQEARQKEAMQRFIGR